MSTASKAAAAKAEHPERYCTHPRCLWQVWTPRMPDRYNPCRKHPDRANISPTFHHD